MEDCNGCDVATTTYGGYLTHVISIWLGDESPADAKGMGQKMLDEVYEIYNSDLARKGFPYDGEKSLFSVGPLPHNRLEFTMVLADASPGSRVLGLVLLELMVARAEVIGKGPVGSLIRGRARWR
ncbi:hypothetical protein OROHE_010038 [Orobanche hederae]